MSMNHLPDKLDDELKFILGRPNFWCGPYAHQFQKAGYDIPTKAESEQAFVIHWLLKHYLQDPVNWRENSQAEFLVVGHRGLGAEHVIKDHKEYWIYRDQRNIIAAANARGSSLETRLLDDRLTAYEMIHPELRGVDPDDVRNRPME